MLEGIVETPVIPEGYKSSFAQYTIKLKNKEERDTLQAKLKEEGIPSMIYYVKPMHKQGAFNNCKYEDIDFEVTNKLCDTVLSLPMHPYLSEDDVIKICNLIRRFVS
jgi:dTDP-4-amino-4,6-dideoxygalactose transaminase